MIPTPKDNPMTQSNEGNMLAPMWLFDHVAACIRDGKATEEMAQNIECLRRSMEAQAARIAELESERDTSARDYCNLMDRHDAHFVAWQSAKARAEAAEAEVARLREAVSLTARADNLREEYHKLPNDKNRIGDKRSKKSHARDAWLRAFRKAARVSRAALQPKKEDV